MTTTIQQRSGASSWQSFCEWVTSTNNRLYVGWFGVLMIPTLLAATICFVIAFVAAPPVDIDGIREACRWLPDLRQQHHLRCCCSFFKRHRPALLPIWEVASSMSGALQRRSFPAGCLPLPDRHLRLHGSRVGTLLPPGHARPWICIAYSAPVAAASAVFLVYPFGQGSSLTPCPWASLAPSTTCWCSRLSTTS